MERVSTLFSLCFLVSQADSMSLFRSSWCLKPKRLPEFFVIDDLFFVQL